MGRLKPLAATHPLVPTRRQGVVADITNADNATPPNAFTVGVVIGGDPTATSVQCAYLDSYFPTVGDIVYLLENQGDFVVIGAVGQSPTKGTISRAAAQTFTSSTSATAITWDTFTSVLQNCSGGSTGITVNATGRYLVECRGIWQASTAGRRVFWPFVNGSQYGDGDSRWPSTAVPGRIISSFQVDASAADVLSVWAFQDSGASLTLTAVLNVVRVCS
jgi:hypothetical protein